MAFRSFSQVLFEKEVVGDFPLCLVLLDNIKENSALTAQPEPTQHILEITL